MDFLIPETIEHVTRFGIKIPVYTPCQIMTLSDSKLMDPDFYFINKVDLETSSVLNAVYENTFGTQTLADQASARLSNVSMVAAGALTGAILGYGIAKPEHKKEGVAIGTIVGATIGYMLRTV